MKYLIDEIKKNNNKKMSYLFTEEFYFELIDKEKKQIEESKGHEIKYNLNNPIEIRKRLAFLTPCV